MKIWVQGLLLMFVVIVAAPSSSRAQSPTGWSWRNAELDSAYWNSGFVNDPVRRKIYRFGGVRGIGLSSETWEFDGRRWRQLHPAHSPPPLASPLMAFDPVRKEVLLFGGFDAVNDRYGGPKMSGQGQSRRTWSWDGQDWKELFPKNSPPGRWAAVRAMVTDPKGRRVILYSGLGNLPGGLAFGLDDTWEWDGKNWTEIKSPKKPSARLFATLGFHEGSGKIVLFGGWKLPRGPSLNDTWVLNGKSWELQKQAQASAPARRSGALATSDFFTKELWVYGGQLHGANEHTDDLWSWNGQKWKLLGKGYGKGKTWVWPWPQFLGRIGPRIYLELRYHPGSPTKTLVTWETFSWNRSGWKSVDRLSDVRHLPARYERIIHDPGSGRVLRFQVVPVSYGQNWGTSVEVLRLEGRAFRPVPVTGTKPRYLNWTMPLPYHDTLRKEIRFFTAHVDLKDYGLWTFNGSTWKFQHVAADKNTQLAFHVEWDPRRKRPVTVVRSRFYSFDGKKWRAEFEDKSGPREGRVLYDHGRKTHVLLEPFWGGQKQAQFKTWELSGRKWTQIRTSVTPTISGVVRQQAFVPELGGIHIAGGQDAVTKKALPWTWLYDGKDWKKLSLPALPERRLEDRMSNLVYDGGLRRVLAFYEKHHPFMYELSFEGLGLTQPLLKPGQSTMFQVAMPGQGGRPFLLGLSLSTRKGLRLFEDALHGPRWFPLDWDSMLAWSLGGPILTMLDATGRGKISLHVPNAPGIPGMDIWASGVTLNLKGTPMVGKVSNVVSLQILR